MGLYVVTVPSHRLTHYGVESRVQTVYQRARTADEAIRVVLTKIGPFGEEWTVGPHVAAMELPIVVCRRWLAEVDGVCPD